MQQHHRGPRPHWPESRLERFTARLEAAAASCETVTGRQAVVDAVLAYLTARGLGRELGLAGTPLLTSLQWPADVVIHPAMPRAQHLCVISQAVAGIAETGSLVMRSHGSTPVSMNFLPDHFLCVLPQSQLVDHIEDAWQLLRNMADRMPRAINLVTGPSRTADVEQTIQLGAHGPRQLHVILLANE